jgi:hypothetical protein
LRLSSYIVIRKLLHSVFNILYFRYSYAGGKFTHIVLEANSYLVCQKMFSYLARTKVSLTCSKQRQMILIHIHLCHKCYVCFASNITVPSTTLSTASLPSLKVSRTKFCVDCFYLYRADCMSLPSLICSSHF